MAEKKQKEVYCQSKVANKDGGQFFTGLENLNSAVIGFKCPNKAVVQIKILRGMGDWKDGETISLCNVCLEYAVKRFYNLISADGIEWETNRFYKKMGQLIDG